MGFVLVDSVNIGMPELVYNLKVSKTVVSINVLFVIVKRDYCGLVAKPTATCVKIIVKRGKQKEG